MGRGLSGEWDEVRDVETCAGRVSLVLKADIRRGVMDGLTRRVARVEELLG